MHARKIPPGGYRGSSYGPCFASRLVQVVVITRCCWVMTGGAVNTNVNASVASQSQRDVIPVKIHETSDIQKKTVGKEQDWGACPIAIDRGGREG